MNVPTLQYRRFRADMIETYKITHGNFEDTCVKHLFGTKSTNREVTNMPSKSETRTPLPEEITLRSV